MTSSVSSPNQPTAAIPKTINSLQISARLGGAVSKPRRYRVRGGADELQLELGNLFPAFPGWYPYLPATFALRRRLDARYRTPRMGDCAIGRHGRRRHPHIAKSLAGAIGQCIRRAVPQHSAAGADVSLVLRTAGTRTVSNR